MSRIVVASYMVRYPLGGMMSWVLQYLLGLQALGHQVYFVEQSAHEWDCYHPIERTWGTDFSYGITSVNELLSRFGLGANWCYVDNARRYHGMSKAQIEEVFRTADLYIQVSLQDGWWEESQWPSCRILMDGDPGFTQIRLAELTNRGEASPEYDAYFTNGRNVGTSRSPIPDAGRKWHPTFHPVMTSLIKQGEPNSDGPFTTVMTWQSYESLTHDGVTYGQKDIEFAKFIDLPRMTDARMIAAIGGMNVPESSLREAGWELRDATDVTLTYDSFRKFIDNSGGEFSVAKNGYVVSNSGWFSDRSAAYLAAGRPVVLQDTSFSEHLPCGKGLFAVDTVDEARDAIASIKADWSSHSKAARDISEEFLDAPRIMRDVLAIVGLA